MSSALPLPALSRKSFVTGQCPVAAPNYGPAAAAAVAAAAAMVAASTGGVASAAMPRCRDGGSLLLPQQVVNAGCGVHGSGSALVGPPPATALSSALPGGMVAPPTGAAVPLAAGVRLGVGCGGDLAHPDTVQREKEHYANDLEEQLKRGMEVLAEMHKQQTEDLHARANQERMRYDLAMDQQVKQRELLLSQEYNAQLMQLQQAAQAKRAELEQQATGLTLEFQQRKVQEEFLVQQLGIQQQHQEAQQRLSEEMQKLGLQPGSPDDLLGYLGMSHAPNGLMPLGGSCNVGNTLHDLRALWPHGLSGQSGHCAGLAPDVPGPGVAMPCAALPTVVAAPPRPQSSRSSSIVRSFASPAAASPPPAFAAGRGCAAAPPTPPRRSSPAATVTAPRSAWPSAGRY